MLYDLLGCTLFVASIFQLIMEMSCDVLWECNYPKFHRLLANWCILNSTNMRMFSPCLKPVLVSDAISLNLKLLTTIRGKYLEGENIGEFGKFVAIRRIFTLQMS